MKKSLVSIAALLALAVGYHFSIAQERATGSARGGAVELQPARTPDVVFVPTPHDVVDKMLELAEIKPSDVVYDLGCGDGRIVVAAAKKRGVKAYGFDIDPKRVAESLENVRTNKVEHLVTIKQADIFTLDLSKADVVTLYLLPQLNVRLIPQLEKMKPGSRIVSQSFDMEGIKPVKVVEDGTRKVYKWTVPLQRESATGATSASVD